MIGGKRLVVVVPAYNASSTLEATVGDLDRLVVDQVIVVDDGSRDSTAELAERLGCRVVRHERNMGYGANQKTCYREALAAGADIVVMVHGDYQYSPRLVPALAGLIASGHYDIALGSRILGNGAREGGMPRWRYVANRGLTFIENMLVGQKLSEYHTGLRGWSSQVLRQIPLAALSDDFVFDAQILAIAIYAGWRIGEISCPTRYHAEASSINFRKSVLYGFGVLSAAIGCRRAQHGSPRGMFTLLSAGSEQLERGADAGPEHSALRDAGGWA
jgi:glycosyltransferase involved in cell wall biosynthesis